MSITTELNLKIMKYSLIFGLLLSFPFFKAQQTYPLNTFPDDVPSGSYMKDLDNELIPFVGTWVADFGGKTISLLITRQERKIFKMPKTSDFYYQDALNINYTVKGSNGVELQNNNNVQYEYDRKAITSMFINNGIVNFYYTGTNCGVGWGSINLKKISNTEVSWTYLPNDTVLTTKNCQGNPDITIYLPETKNLIFTKH